MVGVCLYKFIDTLHFLKNLKFYGSPRAQTRLLVDHMLGTNSQDSLS
jgi:hypothetical protein